MSGGVGQLVLGIAGGIVGAFFGVPQLGFLAGSLLGGAIFGFSGGASKGGPKLSDLHVTSSAYGGAIPVGWGTCRIGGNVIWAYPLQEHKHSSGGKGGPKTYTYSFVGAVALCATDITGPVQKILKIWADTKLVYDATGESGISKNIPGSGGGGGKGSGVNGGLAGTSVVNGGITNAFNKVGKFRLYSGTQDQMPDPALEALVGAANAQAYRGMAYVVFDNIDLTNYGNRVPNFTFEVAFNNDNDNFAQAAFGFTFDTSVLTASLVNTNCAIDAFRQRAYFISGSSGTSTTSGIHAESLATGLSVMTSSWNRTTGANASRFIIENGMVVADDGYLWMWSAEANYGPYIKIDPDTLLEVGHIGVANSFASTQGSTTTPSYVVPLKLSHTNCLFVAGQTFKDLHLYNLDGMAEIASGNYSTEDMRICGGNRLDNDNAECFGLKAVHNFVGAGTTPLSLYTIALAGPLAFGGPAVTLTLIKDINPADIDSAWTNFNNASYLIFDATDGNVMFFCATPDTMPPGHAKQYLVKVSTIDGGVLWKLDYSNSPGSTESVPGSPDWGSCQTTVASGIFAFLDTHNQLWTVSTQDGTAVKSLWPNITNAGPFIWCDSLGALLFHGSEGGTFSNRWGVLVSSAARNTRQLGTIVSEICGAVGLQPTDIDVSALTDPVEGYVLFDQYKARDSIMPLTTAFTFDAVESDNIIKFVKRGAASIATVPSTDLAVIDAKNGLFVQETRTQEVDIPSELELSFLDPNHNFQQATQYARRIANPYPTMHSAQRHTESLAIVAEPGFMKQLAEKLLFSMWVERVSYKTKFQWGDLRFDATDVITITLTDGSTITTRIGNIQIGADLSLEVESVAQSTPSYSSVATTEAGLGFSQQTLAPPVATRLFLMDMPLLRDVDDTGQSFTIMYDAASAYGETWAGAEVYQSSDDINFEDRGPFNSTQAASWGSAVNALGDIARPFSIDEVNTLTVNMVVGGTNLASDTLTNVCNGSNCGVLMNAVTNTLEIIQWLNVVHNADGSYTLSRLLRGRRGTEVFTGNHAIGDVFVVLTSTATHAIKMNLSDLNVDRFYKAVTFGTAVDGADSVKNQSQGRPLKPYAPVQLSAAIAGSDINLGWVRRTRVGGELASYTGIVPLSEQTETYEIDIYNGAGNTVLRTLRVENGATPVSTPGVTYTAAQITADFGSAPASLNLAAYQISTVVGRGFGKMQNVVVH